MNDAEIYQLFSEQFRTIDDHLDDLVSRAENFVQATQIIDAWKQANLNYLTARNKVFAGHANQLRTLVDEFRDAQQSVKQSLADLKGGATTIQQAISVISSAIRKGKALQEAV
ncbi:MAG: hypothetical protein HYX74_00795 [Acidobacteria bacterium]|nr:hypothetical protein [Acidobacteriota bacterium]